MFRSSKARRVLLGFSATSLMLMAAQDALAMMIDYQFVSLFSQNVRINGFRASPASINNSGVVAYNRRSPTTFTNELVVDDGSGPVVIDLSSSGFRADINRQPIINDNGAIALSAIRTTGPDPFALIRVEPDRTVTTLATINSLGSADFKDINRAFIDMNNAGQVSANVTTNNDQFQIVRFEADGTGTVIDTQGADRFNFTETAIDDAGDVAYKAQSPGNTDNVFVGDGSATPVVGLPLPQLEGNIGAGPDINNAGLLAGQTPSSIVTGSGGVVSEVVVDGSMSPFPNGVGRLALNNIGQIVFEATTVAGGTGNVSGLFFGDDPISDKLIQQGDPLFGGIVSAPGSFGNSIRFGGAGGFNDLSQVVFRVQIDQLNPSIPVQTHLVRADPRDAMVAVPEPSTLALFAIGLAGLGVAMRRQIREQPNSTA